MKGMNQMKEAVIVSAVRTPLGSFNGSLGALGATQLGALVITEAIKRAQIDKEAVNEIVMGQHGVIVRKGLFHQGVFLPQVATETGWTREQFLSNLCSHKAGLPPDAWKDPKTRLEIFTANVFSLELSVLKAS